MSDLKDKERTVGHLDRIARELDLDMDVPLGATFAAALREEPAASDLSAEELFRQLDAEGLDADADEFVEADVPAGHVMVSFSARASSTAPQAADLQPPADRYEPAVQSSLHTLIAGGGFARVGGGHMGGGFITPASRTDSAAPSQQAPHAAVGHGEQLPAQAVGGQPPRSGFVTDDLPPPAFDDAPSGVRERGAPAQTNSPSLVGGAEQAPSEARISMPRAPAVEELLQSLEVFADDGADADDLDQDFPHQWEDDPLPFAQSVSDSGALKGEYSNPEPSPETQPLPEDEASDGVVEFGGGIPDAGDRMIPRISIHAFCVKTGTIALMRRIQGDRRLKNVAMEVREGGLPGAILYYASETTPNLLIIEAGGDPNQLLRELDQLAEYCDENIKVLIIGETNDIRLYRELMGRGVSEYLVKPVDPVQLIRSIGSLFADPEAPFTGRTIAVTGVKGGVGASCIAHNLAWSLAERVKVNATLVDLDLNFGTSGLDFNQDVGATIADALLSPDRFDDAVMGRLITKATDRLSLFTAPATLDRTYNLDPETYVQVLDQVRGSVPFVILDLPHIWSDWFKTTVIGADEIIVVAAPELASLRNGKNLIDFLKAARPNDAPPKLVLNMVGVPKRPEIPAKDFGQAIGLEPSLVVPFEPQLFGTASNNGQMIFDVAADSKCSIAVDQLAAMLTGRTVQAEKPSLLKKILGR